MSNRFGVLALFVFAYLLVPSWAHAAILYDESISGDLAPFDPIVLNLAAGQNSVLGSAEYTTSTVDFDSFRVSLGAGLMLTSIDYLIIDRSIVTGTSFLRNGYEMRNGGYAGAILAATSIDILGASQQSMFSSALPVSGVYSFATDGTSLSRSGPGGSWDYEIRFNVSSSVPEPASLAIWGGLGIAGLVAARRRKKVTA